MATQTVITEQERQRILKRIAEIDRKKAEYLRKNEQDKKKLALFESENKILYFGHEGKGYLGKHGVWELNRPQRLLASKWADPSLKTFTYCGGNRSGKTFIGFTIGILSSIMGRFPWEPEEMGGHLWDLLGWKPPIKIRWVGQDWEAHIKTVLMPTIKELWPKARPIESRKNNMGVDATWTDQMTGSTIEVMSNKQEPAVFEGWAGHIVCYDEPPKREIRIACARGLIDFNGRELFTATLLKEAWIDQEVINAVDENGIPEKTVYNIHTESYDNLGFGINKEGLDQFTKILTEEEKDARLRGIPSYKQGLILNMKRETHLKDRFDIPIDWMIDIAIDPHPKKPHHVLFLATSRNNFKYFFYEIVGHGDGHWIAEEIIKVIKRNVLRVNQIIIDPAAKGDSNNENTLFDKVDIVLGRHGFTLETAGKDKDSGIIELNSWLNPRNEEPALHVFNDMPHAIRQLTGWMFIEKGDDKGMPSKVDDDQCENAYRLINLNTIYYPPEEEKYEDEMEKPGERNKITGY